MDCDGYDKHWARKYVLDPLTDPEPSQETGPGSSHFNPHFHNTRPLSFSAAQPRSHSGSRSASQSPKLDIRRRSSTNSRTNTSSPRNAESARNPSSPPSRPHSRPHSYHSSNSHSSSSRRASRTKHTLETHAEDGIGSLVTPPHSPEPIDPGVAAAFFSLTGSSGKEHRGIRHSASVRDSPSRSPSRSPSHRRDSDTSALSRNTNQSSKSRNRHSVHLNERHPGDLTHRPLDMIKRETRVADRRHRKHLSGTDTIDRLDTIGPTYHHDGPYEATLASRNRNKRYSPLEAVRESNLAALRATPREFIIDSLVHHRPLQGTSSIPPGGVDAHGNVMKYEEGADLMREPDAAGGAYKRYDFVNYLPEDLKGKGEPSFSIERDLKKGKPAQDMYEMVDQPLMAKSLRRKSVPVGFTTSANAPPPVPPKDYSKDKDQHRDSSLGRQNSTSHRISEGLKRRFGSLRRKGSPTPDS